MDDDDLTSYWDILHPPSLRERPPEPQKPEEKPKPFCLRCGLPPRICDGSLHKHHNRYDFREGQRLEEQLFYQQSVHLTEEEKQELRRRLVLFRHVRDEPADQWAARRREFVLEGRIPMPMWRLEMYRRFFNLNP